MMNAKKRKSNLQFTDEQSPLSTHSNEISYQERKPERIQLSARHIERYNNRKLMLKNTKNIKNTTRMLVSIVFFFFFCQLPNLFLNVYEAVRWDPERSFYNPNHTEYYLFFITISKFLIILSLSFNFLFYCCFNEKFKVIFKQKFYLTQTNSNDIELTFRTITDRSTRSRKTQT